MSKRGLPAALVAHQFKKGAGTLPPNTSIKGPMAGKLAGQSKPQAKAIASTPPVKPTMKGQNVAGAPGVSAVISPHGDPSNYAPQTSAMKHMKGAGSVAHGVPVSQAKRSDFGVPKPGK